MSENVENTKPETRGNKPGREPRPSDYENLQKAQGKQTGPKTEEGKDVNRMNALKTGLHVKRFDLLRKNAGKMSVCSGCEDEQKEYCAEQQLCEIQVHTLGLYELAQKEQNPSHIEHLSIVQITTMEMILRAKLKFAIENLHETYYDEKGIEHHKIGNDDLLVLSNLMKQLNKSPEDMLLTRKSADISADAFEKEVNEEISKEEATKYLLEVRKQVSDLKNAINNAETARETDNDVKEYRKQTGQAEGNDTKNIDTANLGDSPFAKNRSSEPGRKSAQ